MGSDDTKQVTPDISISYKTVKDINGLRKMRITHRQRLFFCMKIFGSFRPCRTLDPDKPQYVTPLESTIPIFSVTGFSNGLVTFTFKNRFVSSPDAYDYFDENYRTAWYEKVLAWKLWNSMRI